MDSRIQGANYEPNKSNELNKPSAIEIFDRNKHSEFHQANKPNEPTLASGIFYPVKSRSENHHFTRDHRNKRSRLNWGQSTCFFIC
jgi:hypothetical protein